MVGAVFLLWERDKSKFSVRSAEMRRICTGLGRGRRLSTPRPTQIYTLFYALRAVVFACKCGASPYRDNKTVRIPAKSKFSGRLCGVRWVYTNPVGTGLPDCPSPLGISQPKIVRINGQSGVYSVV